MNNFLQIQKLLKPSISVEVGAFDADFSRKIRSRVVESYAFEASPAVFERFRDDLVSIHYLNLAISDHCGSVGFHFESDQADSESGSNSIKLGRGNTRETIAVKAAKLDCFFENFTGRVALWIDCEGANKEVLLGGSEFLSLVDSIYIEVEKVKIWNDSWLSDDVQSFLTAIGFKKFLSIYSWEAQSNDIYVRASNLNVLQRIYLFWFYRTFCALVQLLRKSRRKLKIAKNTK